MADIADKTQNVNICSDDDTKKVDVITDGSLNRLAVDAAISSDDSPTKYTLGVDYDSTGVLVGTSDVSLFSYSGTSGVIDFIAAVAGSSTYEIAIYTDGVQRFRITMDDLGSQLGLANATNVPLWVETANKNFRWHPPTQVGFQNSFEVKARSTTGSNTIKHLILYRTK